MRIIPFRQVYLQNQKVPYVLIAGDKELENGKVSIRKRGVGPFGEMTVDEFIDMILDEIKTKKA